jgi:TNF receptor-associated protein 1
MEINPSHPLIVKLNEARVSNPETAKVVLDQVCHRHRPATHVMSTHVVVVVVVQIFDNALIAAGLLDDPRSMIPRLNTLLQSVLTADKSNGNHSKNDADASDSTKP